MPEARVKTIRTRQHAAILFAASIWAAGCAQENPTDVGGSLLPGGVRTYEVILDPTRFLLSDTSFGGYSDPRAATFFVLARAFEGVLNANVIATVTLPSVITVRDSAGNARPDSAPVFFGGRVIVTLDSLAGRGPDNASLRLFRLAEDYDVASTTWALRLDTGNVKLPWSVPGGTAGSPISSATWQPRADSLTFRVDSVTIAAWADTLSPVRGFVIRGETPGLRIRATGVSLVIDARSSIRRDTVFTTTITPPTARFLFDPVPPAAASNIVAAGTPAFRAMLRLKERLDTLALPCLDAAPGCTVRLGDASINSASLLFEPDTGPAGFSAEDSVSVIVRELLVNPAVPLERTPLGAFAATARRAPPPGSSSRVVEIPIGEYIRQFTGGNEQLPPSWLALVGAPEGASFGHVAFKSRPRLRLILSVGTELRLR